MEESNVDDCDADEDDDEEKEECEDVEDGDVGAPSVDEERDEGKVSKEVRRLCVRLIHAQPSSTNR